MENTNDMYFEDVTPANEIKGFTKSFQKRTKSKKTEDTDVIEILSYVKAGTLILGAKVTEKAFKNGAAKKVFVASNCDEFALKKVNHYAKISNVDVVRLELDNEELGEKLAKPFLVSMVCVVGN